MKILEVIFSLTPGGAERFVVDLSNELSKADEVVVLTLKDDKVDPENRTFYKFDLSTRVTYKNLGLDDGFNLKKIIQVYKAIRAEKADIVHLNLRNVPKYCILAILLLHRKTKFVQTIHNDMSGYNELFYRIYFETIGRLKWVHYVALSDTNYKDLKRMHRHTDACCIVNGRAKVAPTDQFNNVKAEIESYRETASTKVFLHVARCGSQKNQDLLVDAFNVLEQKGQDVKLLIIGAGFDSERGQRLLGKAAKNTFYLGTKKNVCDYMLNSDLFTLSSAYEGMPITLLEASLAGIPAVSTPVCGAVDMIVNGKNGYLSKDFTLETYVEALENAIANFDFIKNLANEMKEKSPFTMEACARKYRQFFEQ
ncbi:MULTISPECIES: glycosyltransferase [unclassified Fibrobacter]|uniref:glycosyltransferase n=1 Tax=unclassified Fibrobacter TaxID=2634177 RepID=UPI000D6AA3B0|nr:MULTISPECIES: glycosyltransferase [unclassified Fibrobacter]PWJ58616.1 glycosyltransferase involved in cell wall biosynthesis [Fibrobacter sp. UWR4]PZW62842.1 glycosyltransferase involved in cell wall biosynthesis [Fibrobacter sp. UWR1]